MIKVKRAASSAITLALALVFLLSTFQIHALAVNLGSISYWFSDGDSIGRWTTMPGSVNTQKLDTSKSSFIFYVSMSHAIEKWNDALGRSIAVSTVTTAPSSSDKIIFYGGTQAQLDKQTTLGSYLIPVPNDITGRVTYNTPSVTSYEGEWTYGFMTKYGYKHEKIYGYIVDKDNTENQQRNTSTHELGHALGWRGHLSTLYSTSVMYLYLTSITVLTAADKNQLSQVYP